MESEENNRRGNLPTTIESGFDPKGGIVHAQLLVAEPHIIEPTAAGEGAVGAADKFIVTTGPSSKLPRSSSFIGELPGRRLPFPHHLVE
jgi:hypothetical protein